MVDLPAILPDFSTEATYAFTSCSEAALLVTRTWSELSSPLYANKFLKTVGSLAASARMSAQRNSVRAFRLQCCFNLINDFKSSSKFLFGGKQGNGHEETADKNLAIVKAVVLMRIIVCFDGNERWVETLFHADLLNSPSTVK
nr:hypothetical protein Iba_chr02fCG5640 [Ipomoea batatas]